MINRFVHSYWSKPSLQGRWGIDKINQTITNMWYFATSVAYLKKLNQEIVLYTDDFGKKLLNHIPYNHIYQSLNNIPEWMDDSIWACGKMYAIESELINSIHIDGDVFIKSQECIDKLNYFNGDVIVQNLEDASCYLNTIEAIKHIRFPKGVNKNLDFAYNTGLFGFKNEELKKLFLETYFKYAEKISKSIDYKFNSEKDVYISPDLIIEQKFMYDLSKNYNVDILLEKDNEYESSRSLGYQHLLGTQKYPQLSNCKRVLKILNPELYKLCELKEKEFLNE